MLNRQICKSTITLQTAAAPIFLQPMTNLSLLCSWVPEYNKDSKLVGNPPTLVQLSSRHNPAPRKCLFRNYG